MSVLACGPARAKHCARAMSVKETVWPAGLVVKNQLEKQPKKPEACLVRAAMKLLVVEEIYLMSLKACETVYIQIARKNLICSLICMYFTIFERKK